MRTRTFRNGSALITCTIVLVVVSALAVSLAAISGANLQVADNQQEANRAFASAESGLEVMRYWLGRVKIPSTTPPEDYLSTIIAAVRSDLETNSITNFTVNTDGSIPTVTLNSTSGQTFMGQCSSVSSDPTIVKITVAGASGAMSRTITVDFSIEPYRFPIFDYGIAIKGGLEFPNNPTLTGATQNWEADIYIESAGSALALEVGGNANFDGDIDIGNPLASVDFAGAVQIAGEYGATAIANHVNVGADPVEFPIPDTAQFQDYATGGNLDPSVLTAPGTTLVNTVIPPGMNPTFEGNVRIQGVLFINAPNIVTFAGNVDLQGLIVFNGSAGPSEIEFAGNFASSPCPPGVIADGSVLEGSCILAPHADLSFTGNFSAIEGVIAADSVYFSANASAAVKGTVISYSTDPDENARVEGNVSLNFDRAAMVEIPAGFDLLRVLIYHPNSYALAF